MRQSSFSSVSEYVSVLSTLNIPLVIVPVLSITTALTADTASIDEPLLKSIPFFEPAPIPAKYVSGTLRTIAHGQLITRKVTAV